MKVYVIPSDTYGVGHYRTVWPAEAAAMEAGVEVRIVPPQTDSGFGGWMNEDGSMEMVTAPADADVVVLQRTMRAHTALSITKMRKKGVAVVVDVDDDLTCIDPANPAFAAHHPRNSPSNNWNWLIRACADATLVTCSTPALAERFGRHGRVRVLENCVPARFLDVPHVDESGEDPLVGWAGSMHSHPRDLDAVGTGVRDAGVWFRTVGPPAGVGERLHLGPVGGTGDVDFGGWPGAVARLDVGIAPLADTKFNRAKSWLKPLEYAALGVPFVASPTPEYESFVRGLGLQATLVGMAKRPKDWAASLRILRNPVIRAQLSEAGRAAVKERHTYEGEGWRWAEAWAHAGEKP